MDNVNCMNCGFDGLVDYGADICPECGFDGALAWKDDEPQEVEVEYMTKTNVEVLKGDILNGVTRHGGFILSESTNNGVHLLAKIHDLLKEYGVKPELRVAIKNMFIVQGWKDGDDLWTHVYHNRLRTLNTLNEDGQYKLDELWNKDVSNYLDELSPEGYYFGTHEGDLSCYGWWKA